MLSNLLIYFFPAHNGALISPDSTEIDRERSNYTFFYPIQILLRETVVWYPVTEFQKYLLAGYL